MTLNQLQIQFNYFRDTKKYSEGIKVIENWIETHKETPKALYMLAELLDKRALRRRKKTYKKIDLQRAEDIYDYLIETYPTLKEGYFGKIRILLNKKDKKAFDVAKKYIKISGDEAYNMYLGHVYLDFNDYKNAEKHYLKAYPYIKGHYGPDYALATLYNLTGNNKKAQVYAQKGIEKFKKMPKKYQTSKLTRTYIYTLKEILNEV